MTQGKILSDQLHQAITLIKSGEQQKGRQLLADLVTADPNNETAWLWMSSVVDTDDQRRYCLKQVLLINPNNSLAYQGLEKLKAKPQAVSASKPPILPQEQTLPTKLASLTQSDDSQPHKSDPSNYDKQKPKLNRLTPVKKTIDVNTSLDVKSPKPSPIPLEWVNPSMPDTKPAAIKDTSNFGMGCLGAVLGVVLFTLIWGFIVGVINVNMVSIVGLIVMMVGISGLIGGLVRGLGQGQRATFGLVAAIASFATYFWGIYLAVSGQRAPWESFLFNALTEHTLSYVLFLITFFLPLHLIAALIVMALSFGIAIRRPRRQPKAAYMDLKEPEPLFPSQSQQTGMSSRAWGVIFGFIMVCCLGITIALFRRTEATQIMIGLFMMALGYYPIAGAIMNWDWFMKSRRSRLIARLLGRNGARIFFALTGMFILFLGFVLML